MRNTSRLAQDTPKQEKKQKNLIFLHDHQVFEISFFKKKERTYEAGGMGDVD